MGVKIMTDAFVIEYTNNKIKNIENKNFVRYTFYELRIKNNLTDDEVDRFLRISREYFENRDYKVYFTNAKYVYKNANMMVQPNELMIAVKE